ncbi:MAG: glycosyltransferase, partial [Deltaproteobacteria bacterium]|nr:glycosyltransferase [Deltaproteobacteria bacterium]
TALTLFGLFGSFYAYFGYPLVLRFLLSQGKRVTPPGATAGLPDGVSIVIAARNEERVIREKIRKTLELPIPAQLTRGVEIIVASDCSDDQTDAIVREFEGQGVRLVRSSERKGKEFAQAMAADRAKHDIVLFTDAKVSLDADLLEKLLPYFADPSVGAVSSVDRVEQVEGGGSGEGMYVRYEMWLRSLETAFDSVVGLSGSCFAVRRRLCLTMRSDIPSDFSLLLEARARGLRGVSAEDVICRYRAVKTEEEEFERKVRTVLRGMTALFVCREVMDPRAYGTFAWQVISHKLMRWLVPLFLVVSTLGSIALADESLFFLLVANGSLLFFGIAFLAYIKPSLRERSWAKVPLFFSVVNLAIAVAWIRYLSGRRATTWQPSAKMDGAISPIR